MRRSLSMLLFFFSLAGACASAMNRYSAWCENGNQKVSTVGVNTSTTLVQRSYPGCTVTVYVAGTVTLATIYADNNLTPKSNPFTASTTNGSFFFYGEGRFDATISGANIGAPFTIGDIQLEDMPSITDLGMVCDGVTINSSTVVVSTFAYALGRSLHVPGATCILDNSGGPIQIPNWTGKLWGDTGSTLSCTTLANRCLEFDTPSNVDFDKLIFSYKTTASVRGSGFTLYILSGANITLTNLIFLNSGSAGLVVQQSDNVKTSNITYTNLLANGLLVTNSTHVLTDNTHCNNVQDACEEFSGYDAFAGVPGGTCQWITVTNLTAYNSFSGVLFNACADATLNGFAVYNAYNFGVAVIQDVNTTTTKWPYRVAISNGTINTVGLLSGGFIAANGILLEQFTASPSIIPVVISNVSIYNTTGDLVRIGQDVAADPSNFNLSLSNIIADTATAGECYRFAAGGVVTFSNIQARNCYAYALNTTPTAGTTLNVSGTNLYIYDAENAARADPRATLADNPGNLIITGVTVADDRNPAVGYQLADNLGTGPIWVSEIVSIIPNGALSLSPSTATSQYLIFDFFKYNAQTIQVDATGVVCQLTVGGFTTPVENIRLCYDTTGDFGWIQATHTGIGNKLLKLNPNGGGLNLAGVLFTVGTGSPAGVVTGSPGDLYLNNAGGASTTLYVKESGVGTTGGWVGK